MKLALALVVLPLGDSITEGVPTADGYRAPLVALMAKAGVQVKYVGSLRSPAGAHEGWSGFTTAELIPRARAALARHRPDVILLHIGTNDLGMGVSVEEAAANVRALLILIDERSRTGGARGAGGSTARPIQVLLAKIVARDLFGDGRDPLVDQYNDLLVDVADERRKAGQAVQVVDIHRRVDPRRDLADALHPSERGYANIAAGWAEALQRLASELSKNRQP
jgi:lysophospholipase L1-like esterase